jgi:acetylglutamate kinase
MVPVAVKTEILIEALPYIRRYAGRTFVVKYGGAAMTDAGLEGAFAQDVALLAMVGIRVVIVHGGGNEITGIAAKLGIPTRFVDGQRVTDAPMMEVVQMVLAGKTNKDVVARINRHHGNAVGLCGIDADLLRVRTTADAGLGFVGEITAVNTAFLLQLLSIGAVPVIAPVGVDPDGRPHNINADVAAAEIASALRAEKLVFLSDVEGVIAGGELVRSMDRPGARALIDDSVITGGMIPKIRSAFAALDAGVGKVHLIDGRRKHSLLLEIFTDEGIGTEVVHSSPAQEVSA